MTKLTIVANIKANADQVDLVKAELEKLIDITRAEQGWLHQDNENPAHFLFYENWASHDLWQKHMGAQHLQDYLAATEGEIDTILETARLSPSSFGMEPRQLLKRPGIRRKPCSRILAGSLQRRSKAANVTSSKR